MIAVIGAIALVSMLAGATLAATNGDLNLTQRDLNYKRAHAAAEAGLADYSFHLNNDNSYWARCTEVRPESNRRGEPGGLDRQSPQRARKRSRVRDRTAAGLHQPVEECDPSNPTETMLEHGGRTPAPSASARPGTRAPRRSRSSPPTNGRACSITCTSPSTRPRPATYWTETSGKAPTPTATKIYREGDRISRFRGSDCSKIDFVSEDQINGPLHTNDELPICGTPEFGRDGSDVIEVSAPPEGWRANS